MKCEDCYIAQNYNLEDDDSPCLNCDEDEIIDHINGAVGGEDRAIGGEDRGK